MRCTRPLADILIEAGSIRFKPILLTALAAMIGAAVILTDPIFQGARHLAPVRPRVLDAAHRAGHSGHLQAAAELRGVVARRRFFAIGGRRSHS